MYEVKLAGRTVLVVENDYHLAHDLGQMLEVAGATVLGPVPSVTAALRLLGEEKPDAAVLDVNLGSETSFPVAEALAADGVPFLFATACARTALPERHSAVPWLPKPTDPSTTLREIAHLLEAAA